MLMWCLNCAVHPTLHPFSIKYVIILLIKSLKMKNKLKDFMNNKFIIIKKKKLFNAEHHITIYICKA